MGIIKEVNQIVRDIKEIKIQGARNIAKSALLAYSYLPTNATKVKLINARPTEPMLVNTLHFFEKIGLKKTLFHFDEAQNKINRLVLGLIKNNSVIFTHCHSTNVINALIYAKKNGRNFEVYNTETRPLFQGRKTSKELASAGIKVTEFVDSAAATAISRSSLVFLGADAIISTGVINKIGSGMFAEIAYDYKVPVYVIADSWKFSQKHIRIEDRDIKEIWTNAPKHIRIENPSFEVIKKKFIKSIVSELGILTLEKFVKKASHFF